MKFGYDALGRRIFKHYKQTFTNFVWDGNVPLHEFKTFTSKDALSNDVITWLFEEDSFSPIAKLRGNKKYSILADHLGTPIEAYADDGNLVWERSLNANGKVLKETGIQNFCPFLYQGQSFDNEIELAYNRFRYYDVEDGRYISQDPIGLAGNNPNFYSYTKNSNYLVDLFRLDPLGTGAPLKNGFLFYKNELSLWTIYHKNVDTIMAHVHLGILAYWLVNTIRYQLKQQKSHHNFMVKIMMMK